MKYEYTVSIGSLQLHIICPDASWGEFLTKHYGPFLSPSVRASAPLITIQKGALPRQKALRILSREGNYTIQRGDFISVSSPDFRTTTLAIAKDRYSLNSWLRVFCTMYGLARTGMLLHCAGIYYRSGTYLFAGRSGSGKSTMTRLLGKHIALSDELVLVEQRRNTFAAYSTPFWGELKRGAGKKFRAPVKGVYFLRHGHRLSCARLSDGEALKRLLPTVLFFSKDRTLLEQLLTLAVQFVGCLPAFELTFSLATTRAEILDLINKGSAHDAF